MHKNITCIYNVIWYGPSRIRSPSCASWHDLHHSTAFDLHLVCHGIISIIPPHSISILYVMAWSPSFHRHSSKVHGAPSWLSSSIIIYHLDIYIWHAGHLNVKTTISYHMPRKNKLDVSNLSCIFYVVWGFLGRTVHTYEHVTTTVIKYY
jgi:hypothetical protein